MANSHTKASVEIPLKPQQIKAVMAMYETLLEEAEAADEEAGFVVCSTDSSICVHHDETIDLDRASRFIQTVLRDIIPEEEGRVCVALHYAVVCDKPRPDAFSGGAVWIYRDARRSSPYPVWPPVYGAGTQTAFESPQAAVQFCKEVENSENALIDVIIGNIRTGEYGFASEVISAYSEAT